MIDSLNIAKPANAGAKITKEIDDFTYLSGCCYKYQPIDDNIPKSYFFPNYHSEIKMIPKTNPAFEYSNTTPDFLMIFILLAFSIFAFLQHMFPKFLSKIVVAIYSNYMFQVIKRDFSPNFKKAATGFTILYLLNLSIFIYELVLFFNAESNVRYLRYFLMFLLFVFVYFIVKQYLIKLLGYMLNIQDIALAYLKYFEISIHISGIFLMISILLIPYIAASVQPFFVYFSILVFFFLYVYRLVRSVLIIVKKDFSIFYMILYLCTLEILPLLLLYKYYVRNFI